VVRRQKTYSAQSGYVYQYFYEGRRDARRDSENGTEYVFDVSADRKNALPVSVFLEQRAVKAWEERNGRPLGGNELYAIAKMALFHAFDEREEPGLMKLEVRVRTADVEGFLNVLGIE
jgi:hypothetical protein